MSRILVAVATHNRPYITELCLSSLNKHRGPALGVVVYDDYSSAFDASFLKRYADAVVRFDRNVGIDFSRRRLLEDFRRGYKEYDLLYITDNDVIHDPQFVKMIKHLFDMQKKMVRRAPVGLYNSRVHNRPDNVISDLGEAQLRISGPGVSQCYDREMVDIIARNIDKIPQKVRALSFDFQWPYVLNRGFMQSTVSYLEHFGRDRNERGLHVVPTTEPGFLESEFDQDRAINPTKYLEDLRPAVISYLMGRSVEMPLL